MGHHTRANVNSVCSGVSCICGMKTKYGGGATNLFSVRARVKSCEDIYFTNDSKYDIARETSHSDTGIGLN